MPCLSVLQSTGIFCHYILNKAVYRLASIVLMQTGHIDKAFIKESLNDNFNNEDNAMITTKKTEMINAATCALRRIDDDPIIVQLAAYNTLNNMLATCLTFTDRKDWYADINVARILTCKENLKLA